MVDSHCLSFAFELVPLSPQAIDQLKKKLTEVEQLINHQYVEIRKDEK